MYVIFDDLLYIRLYLCFYSMIFLSFITMAIPLAVSVVHVLSILSVSVLLPSSESVGTYLICANANKHAYIDKLEIKRFVLAFIYVCSVN